MFDDPKRNQGSAGGEATEETQDTTDPSTESSEESYTGNVDQDMDTDEEDN